jgi:hypothetical protein
MSDRKYRQHGYQDGGQAARPRGGPPRDRPVELRDPRIARDPKVPNLPGFREVVRCARCGALTTTAIGMTTACDGCGTALHSCAQCASFDPSAVYECRQKIAVRVTPKDGRNDCRLFAARVQVERETGSSPATSAGREPSGARRAFDDLFKF